MFRQYKFRNYNFRLIIFVTAISLIGYLAVGSAQESLRQRQMFGIMLGIGLMLFLSLVDYTIYRFLYWFFYVFNIIILGLVLSPLGVEVNGSKRWINIGFQFQPSELAKILLILFFAQFIMKHKDKINSPRILVTLIILLAVPLFLVFKEPDLSTSIMIVVTFCVMVFVGGLSYRIVFALLAVMIPAVVAFFAIILKPDAEDTFLHGYQVTRILAWLEPEKYADSAAYQQLNSITAIGSGQLFGKGLDNNVIASVKNGNFISEPQTDFIFAIVGEELGFIGSAGVVVLILLIVLECFIIAFNAKDLSGTLIASGAAGLIGLQAFLNIAVATGLAPNTGIPLPFVSYGLTSLVSLFGIIGIVINIGLQSKKH